MPAQGLGCQATCTLTVGGKGQGTRRHKRGTEARVRPPAGSLAPVSSAGMVHDEQGAKEALRGQKAPHLLPCPLGSRGSLGRQASARF